MTVDSRVDERTLRELYLAPFEHVWRFAAPWAFMAAYNRVNGTTMTESPLLAEPLKGEWGFDGIVMSRLDGDALDGRGGPRRARPHDAGSERALGRPARRGRPRRPRARGGDRRQGAPPAAPRRARRGARGRRRPPSPRPRRRAPTAARSARGAAAGIVLVRNESAVLPLDRGALAPRRAASARTPRRRARRAAAARRSIPTTSSRRSTGSRAALGRTSRSCTPTAPGSARASSRCGRGEVRDPVTGEPGVRVRYFEADGARIAESTASPAASAGSASRVHAARVDRGRGAAARRAGRRRYAVGVAGVGPFRLKADGRFSSTRTIPPEPGSDPFSAFLDPPERSAERRPVDPAARSRCVRARDRPRARCSRRWRSGARPGGRPSEELARAVRAAAGADVAVVVVGTTDAGRVRGLRPPRPRAARPPGRARAARRAAPTRARSSSSTPARRCCCRGATRSRPCSSRGSAARSSAPRSPTCSSAPPSRAAGCRRPGRRREEDVPVLSTTPVDGGSSTREGSTSATARGPAPAPRPRTRSATASATRPGTSRACTSPAPAPATRPRASASRCATPARAPAARRPGLPVARGVRRRPAPCCWLAGFAVVEAEGGQETHVALELPARAFAHWAGADGWRIEGGEFTLQVGLSAAEHPLRAAIDAPSCSL